MVQRGLLEGLVAGAAMGPVVLYFMGLVTGPNAAGDGALELAVGYGFYAVMFAAPLGLAGSVLALAVLGLVARWHRREWTTSRVAWLAPAIAVGAATTLIGAVGDGWWWFYLAAPPATAITGWRVRRAVARFATGTVIA